MEISCGATKGQNLIKFTKPRRVKFHSGRRPDRILQKATGTASATVGDDGRGRNNRLEDIKFKPLAEC